MAYNTKVICHTEILCRTHSRMGSCLLASSIERLFINSIFFLDMSFTLQKFNVSILKFKYFTKLGDLIQQTQYLSDKICNIFGIFWTFL